MSLVNRAKEVDLKLVLISKVNELKRYELVWEWMEEHQFGDFIKYDDLIELITEEITF